MKQKQQPRGTQKLFRMIGLFSQTQWDVLGRYCKETFGITIPDRDLHIPKFTEFLALQSLDFQAFVDKLPPAKVRKLFVLSAKKMGIAIIPTIENGVEGIDFACYADFDQKDMHQYLKHQATYNQTSDSERVQDVEVMQEESIE